MRAVFEAHIIIIEVEFLKDFECAVVIGFPRHHTLRVSMACISMACIGKALAYLTTTVVVTVMFMVNLALFKSTPL